MGVLEARKNAEKISYPVVGEETKEASNVIDYDIHEEITKDASNVMNANNQTTTGMANIIPGINAPKLIAQTSIVGIPEQEGSFYGTAQGTIGVTGLYSPTGGYSDYYISNNVTISSQDWVYKFTTDGKGIVFPLSGGYEIKIRYYTTGYGSVTRYDEIYVGNILIASHSGEGDTQTYTVNANKGDTLWVKTRVYNNYGYDLTLNLNVLATITPK